MNLAITVAAALLAGVADPAAELRVALTLIGEPLPGATELDDRVVLHLHINPEGRVRVERGPHTPTLTLSHTAHAVIKIVNQSGSRPRLTPLGRYEGGVNPFTLSVATAGRLAPELTGRPIEYRLLAVHCAAPGRHELSIGFEAGQGTQDLAFRGECPVLLTVNER